MTAWTRTSRYALAFAGAMSFSLSASATCKHIKCALDVDQAITATVPVIVQYSSDPTDNEAAAVNGLGPVYNRMHSINALAANVSASQLETLASRPGVKYVSLDRPLAARQAATTTTTATPVSIATSPEFTAEPINAPWAWAQKFDGQGIGIAIIDSGITPTVDLSVKVTPVAAPATVSASVAAAIAAQAAAAALQTGPAVSALSTPAAKNANSAVAKAAAATAATTATTTAQPVAYLGPNRIVFSYNFTSSTATDTADAYGHGTHVAGLIAGNGSSSTGAGYSRTFTGIAPNANLINLRVLDANGQGSDSEVIAAIESAILLKNTYNIKVINLSLGRPIYESYALDPLCQAVEQAWKAGIVVVVAAGNDGRDLALSPEGYGTIEAPGNDPYVITVGAANTNNTAALNDDVMASYSSKGPSFIDQIAKPDIIAPGNLVTSILAPSSGLQAENPAFFTQQNWYVTNGATTASTSYFPLSGTSMATAVASGAVADLMEVAGYLTPDQVKVILMSSANKNVIPSTNSVSDPVSGNVYIAHNDALTQGSGYLDLEAAINAVWKSAWTIPTNAPAMSPVATYDPVSGNVTLVPALGTVWNATAASGATTLWGPTNVYGPNAFVSNGQTVLWGRSSLSGSTDPQGFTVLWGRNTTDASAVLWSSASTAAQTVLWGRDILSSAGTSAGTTVLWGRQTATGASAVWSSSYPDIQ